jgi:hypothetical protein
MQPTVTATANRPQPVIAPPRLELPTDSDPHVGEASL